MTGLQNSRNAVAAYEGVRPKYLAFASEIERTIKVILDARNIKPSLIESRAKELDSFRKKCDKKNEDGSQRYAEPIREITDLAGVRIITFTLGDIDRVCKLLEQEFSVKERKNLGDERLQAGRFGYQSIHYICGLNNDRVKLTENQVYKELVCEIQVRTALQHVWAQIEHGMQYKAGRSLPRAIEQKFVSLAGLLEIGDRELSSIEREYEQLRDEVKVDLEGELTKEAFDQEGATSDPIFPREEGEDFVEIPEPLSIRSLIADERYEEAISALDDLISKHPKSVTHYLARAKARFLSGDVARAKEDIDAADKLSPGSPYVSQLRQKVIEGSREKVVAIDSRMQNELTTQGNDALLAGKGEEAYLRFSEAQELGASKPFSILNRACACLVANDLEGANQILSGLEIRPGTPMEINILALRAMVSCLLRDPAFADQVTSLRQKVAVKGDYSISMSPLRFVKEGLSTRNVGTEVTEDLKRVYGALETNLT